MNIEFFTNKLIDELLSLSEQGIYGVREYDNIMMDFESNLSRDITFLRNDQFELIYDKKANETTFKTTYSGQIIDNDFLNQIRIIDKAKGSIDTIISTMVALNKIDK